MNTIRTNKRTDKPRSRTGWLIPCALVGMVFGGTSLLENHPQEPWGEGTDAQASLSLLVDHPAWEGLSVRLRQDLVQVATEASPSQAVEALERVAAIAPESRWGLRILGDGWLMYSCDLGPGEPFVPYSQHNPPALAQIMAKSEEVQFSNNFPGWELEEEFYSMPDLTPETVSSEVPVLHSNPAAGFTIYLDFTGGEIRNTVWNDNLWKRAVVRPQRFSIDANREEFNADELQYIYDVWASVSEYFSPFSINVTTERPPAFGRKSLHVLIARRYDVNGVHLSGTPVGGFAAMAALWESTDEKAAYLMPAFAFVEGTILGSANTLIRSPDSVAKTVVHEIGHTFGLQHDSEMTRSLASEDFAGINLYANSFLIDLDWPGSLPSSGSGVPRPKTWSPIMGGLGGSNVIVQWSRGEFKGAVQTDTRSRTIQIDNFDDDIAAIAYLAGRARVTLEGEYDEAGIMEMGAVGAEPVRVEGLLAWQQKDSFRVIPQTNQLTIFANPQRMLFFRDYRANKRTASYDRRMLDFVVKIEDEETGSHLVIDDFPGWKRTVAVEAGRSYVVHITPTGRGNPTEWTLIPRMKFDIYGNATPDPYYRAVGYTAYGSRGRYELEISSPATPPEDAPAVAANWQEGAPQFDPLPWTSTGEAWETGDAPAPGAYYGTFESGIVRLQMGQATKEVGIVPRPFFQPTLGLVEVIPYTVRVWVAGQPIALRGKLFPNHHGDGYAGRTFAVTNRLLGRKIVGRLESLNGENVFTLTLTPLDQETNPEPIEFTSTLRPLRFGRANPYLGPARVPVELSDGNGWQHNGEFMIRRNGRVVYPTFLPDGSRTVLSGFVEAGVLPDRGHVSIFRTTPPTRGLDPGPNPMRNPRGNLLRPDGSLTGQIQIDFHEALTPAIQGDINWSRLPFQADTLRPGEEIPLTLQSVTPVP